MFEAPIHWVKGIEPNRLGLMARPRGGEWLGEEVAAWRLASLSMVVSLLEAQEVRELELKEEPALCAAHGIGFRHFPIPDRGTPSSSREVFALVAELHALLGQGKAVAFTAAPALAAPASLPAVCFMRWGWLMVTSFISSAAHAALPCPTRLRKSSGWRNTRVLFQRSANFIISVGGTSHAASRFDPA